jgi:hypothetical protein
VVLRVVGGTVLTLQSNGLVCPEMTHDGVAGSNDGEADDDT